jgi:hypothetical protein
VRHPFFIPVSRAELRQSRLERSDQFEASDVFGIGLDVHEQLGEPRGIFPKMEATDQRRTVGVGSRQHVEQLARGWHTEGIHDPRTEVVHRRLF